MRIYAVHLATTLESVRHARWETACGRVAVEVGEGRGPWASPTATLEAAEVTCATCRRTVDYVCQRAIERAEARELPDNVIPLRGRMVER